MTCTSHGCGRQTSVFLCTKCIVELDDLLQQVPLLIVALDPGILANKVTKAPGSNGETRNTNKAGSQAPMNVDVDLLRDWLKTLLGHRAYDLANNYPTAGQYLDMARMWVGKANMITHGPDTPPIDHAGNAERIKEIAPPMTTRQLLPWLRKHARIHITRADINNWRQRGHLHPVDREPSPTYNASDVLNAYHQKGRA